MLKVNSLLMSGLVSTLLVSNAFAMKFSSKVSLNRVDTIKEDLEYLKTLDGSRTANTFYQTIFKESKLNGESLAKWLDQRLKYIVEQDFNPIEKNEVFILGKLVKDEKNSGVRNKVERYSESYIDQELASIFTETAKQKEKNLNAMNEAVVVMSNYGTALYSVSISTKYLLGLELHTHENGLERIIIDSPRVGIAKIGEGLFQSRLSDKTIDSYGMKKDEVDGMNRSSRITTYLHEARHSDGTGSDLGMGHSLCPKKHDYAGLYACEDAVNGPYAINAAMSFESYVNCSNCSENEKVYYQMTLADACSRIVDSTKKDMCKDCNDKATQEKVTEGIMNCVKAMSNKSGLSFQDLLKTYNYKVKNSDTENVLSATGI